MPPSIKLTPVTSSQIAAIGHDSEFNILAIQFHGKGGNPGSIYHYANFTREDYLSFASAPSIGKHFYVYIKNEVVKYPFEKQ